MRHLRRSRHFPHELTVAEKGGRACIRPAQAHHRAPQPQPTPTVQLDAWLLGSLVLLSRMFPSRVREHAKHLVLDGVACALVGAQLPVSRKGVEGITANPGYRDIA